MIYCSLLLPTNKSVTVLLTSEMINSQELHHCQLFNFQLFSNPVIIVNANIHHSNIITI